MTKESREESLLQLCHRCGGSTEQSLLLYQQYEAMTMEVLEGKPYHTVKQVVDAGVFCSTSCLCSFLSGDE